MNKIFSVVGLGYGDEGKGSWVDYLVRKHNIPYVIRFNGGSQAAHHVVSPEGIVHCFSQFGSGTLVKGVKTCLSKYMLVNPISFFEEARVLSEKGFRDVLERVMVDKECAVITPFNSLLNKILEVSRGNKKHGSCGCGVGLTQQDVETLGDSALYVKDFKDTNRLREKLEFLKNLKTKKAEEIANSESREFLEKLKAIKIESLLEYYSLFNQRIQIVDEEEILKIISKENVVFEGAQGVMIDSQFGFFPYVTRSKTTFENAEELIRRSGFNGENIRIGLLRGYSTRHGNGPFVTEDSNLEIIPCHNKINQWQGSFRIGWFDCVAARYALEVVGGVDVLAITNLDRMKNLRIIKICNSYKLGPGCSELFRNSSGNRILIPAENQDIKQREKRTLLLTKCSPNYKLISSLGKTNPKALLRYTDLIGSLIGKKVGAISLSPSFNGKHETTKLGVFNQELRR